MAIVTLPAPLRPFAGDRAEVRAPGKTVREVIAALERRHPGLGPGVLDARGAVKRYVNVFVNDEDIRALGGLDTPVGERDQVLIVLAMAGG